MQGVIRSGNCFTVLIDNKVYNFNDSHKNFELLKKAVKSNNSTDFLNAFDIGKKIEESISTSGKPFVVDGGVVKWNGKELHGLITDVIIKLLEENDNVEYLDLFLKKLYQNPSANSVSELFDFLSSHRLCITKDGNFLAYKVVRSDFKDKYTGKIDNSIGQSPEMPRNEVDDNFNNECSDGLHVGALSYSGPGGSYYCVGDKVVIVEVNPEDVVSCPRDHNFTKLRVCKYKVISEFDGEFTTVNDKKYTYEEDEEIEEIEEKEEESDNYSDKELRLHGQFADKGNISSETILVKLADRLNIDLDEYLKWTDLAEVLIKIRANKEEEEDIVQLYDLEVGDIIKFTYSCDGKITTRFMTISEISEKYVEGYLCAGDPSYDNGEEYRIFKKMYISDIHIIKCAIEA